MVPCPRLLKALTALSFLSRLLSRHCLRLPEHSVISNTTTTEVMDGDMRRALAAEDSDELQNEGNWLDDDFVVQAAGADDVRKGRHLSRYFYSNRRMEDLVTWRIFIAIRGE